MKRNERIIGVSEGSEKGPLLIVFGGMHGNELAGIEALKLVFKMIEVEPITNPNFEFKGKMVGLIGNLAAYQLNKRFIDLDINRNWTPKNVKEALESPEEELKPELKEIKGIMEIIHHEIDTYQPEEIVVLDLHTTSSHGGIFVITNDDPNSTRIGLELHAPVIQGMINGIKGTTLHYFKTENIGIKTTAVTFESGQHDDPLSINRAIAAVINCLRTLSCVDADHIENRHDQILQEYSKDLPKISELIYRHGVHEDDMFRMLPNYINFQKISKNELLAHDKNGEIRANHDGRMLMPLYQEQGEDGFFLIKTIKA